MNRIKILTKLLVIFVAITFFEKHSNAQNSEPRPLRVLLLGDSTTIGSVCRSLEPKGPHLEDVIRTLLSDGPLFSKVEVINQGRDGEMVDSLLSSGRYDHEIASLEAPDLVFIRYGINDFHRRENFDTNFPEDYRKLLGKLRENFPKAELIPTSIIPYISDEADSKINRFIREVAESHKLRYFDLHARYAKELESGLNGLNYRRFPLSKIPQEQQAIALPFVHGDLVTVLDNRLDAHFRDLPGWFGDRHPNQAGYHLIGDETAKFIRSHFADSPK